VVSVVLLPTYRVVVFAMILAAACSAEGQVELEFLLPETEALSPIDSQLAEITVVTTVPEAGRRSETRPIQRGEPLDLGRIPVGEGIQLAVELRSPTQRLIGYGRGPGPFDVRVGETTHVPVRMRRPFAYVTRPDGIATFDTTLDARSPDYRNTVPLSRAPTVVVPTADGADLIVLTSTGNGSELSLVSTSTHQPSGTAPLALPAGAVEAAVSIDNRFVVVAHDGATGGLSIIELAALRAGAAQPTYVDLGPVGAVALTPGRAPDSSGRAFALLERASAVGCPDGASNSTIIAVSLDDPTQIGPTIPLQVPLHDLAGASDGRLVTADGCGNRIEILDPDDDADRAELVTLTRASAVAILDDRVWAVGTAPAAGPDAAQVLLVSIGIDGTGEKRNTLPALQERMVSPDFSTQGQVAINNLNADEAWAYELAVVPGADQVALLLWSYYHGFEVGEFFGSPIIPEMWAETYEYFLINAADAGVAQRVRTWCDLDWDRNSFPVIDDWQCGQAPDQDVSEQPYVPTRLSVLYGAR
jgi:hypothetical protein